MSGTKHGIMGKINGTAVMTIFVPSYYILDTLFSLFHNFVHSLFIMIISFI